MTNNNKIEKFENLLFNELSQLIEQSKEQLVSYANSTLTILFWQVGKRINEHILQNKRAEYGKQIVVTLARQLTEKYGHNFEVKKLRRMMQFAEQFSDIKIVGPMARHLSWSHFLIILPVVRSFRTSHQAGGSALLQDTKQNCAPL